VAVISTAHGLKFSEFKVGYHERTLPGVTPALANASTRVPATVGAVRDAIARRFGASR
jgi:threonine synthase